ncbi:MAG: diacylglycerol kinase [Candidatus Sumerlaeota bacterium]|nr:diacylglycerol kinase [Candidatus Sumerlaeota bacterium]
MRILVILNGSKLRRWNAALPERLRLLGAERGIMPVIAISRDLAHVDSIIGKAIEAGFDTIVSCGGDGTLHHVVNHPLIHRAAVSMIPAGTINAFLRSEGADVRHPAETFRQLLEGRVVEGRVGLLNGRRFACFASWGYDARVVHKNPSALKRRLRAGSYVVTGIREIAAGRRTAVPGRVRFGPRGAACLPATSVVISKIRNYAGFAAFDASAESDEFEGLYLRDDSFPGLQTLYGSIVARGVSGRRIAALPPARAVAPFTEAHWRSPRPTHVQLDGEAIEFPDTRRLHVKIDPIPQRYLLP